MARLSRLSLPGQLHHILLRGNNGQLIFVDDEDRFTLLEAIKNNAQECSVAVHAYVLMPTYLELLVTPSSNEGLSKMMQGTGRNYVRYFNNRHHRSGSLWDGRFKSTILQSDRYMLYSMIHIDSRPVTEGLLTDPARFAWSSCQYYLGQKNLSWLTTPEAYWMLGNTPFAREKAYHDRLLSGLDADLRSALQEAIRKGWVLGDDAFKIKLQSLTNRRLVKISAGRPRKITSSLE